MELLPFGLSTLTKGTLRKNTTTLEFFVDADNGSDENDGRSWDTAKKTIKAAYRTIPYVISSAIDPPYHFVVLHLKGVFLLDEDIYTENFVDSVGHFIITGTDDVTVVDDNSGSNYTASSYSTSYLTVSSPLWTVDQHRGYVVEILSGPATGQHRTVQKNTTTTITPTVNWSTNPGACTFRFVRPATTLKTDVGGYAQIAITTIGSGFVTLQKLTLEPEAFLGFYGTGSVNMSNCVCNIPIATMGPSPDFGGIVFTHQCRNVTSPFSTHTLRSCGVGYIDTTKTVDITRSKPRIVGSVLPNTTLRMCQFYTSAISAGTRIDKLSIEEGHTDTKTNANIRNTTGALLVFDQGIKISNSNLNLGALTLSNITGNAIECEDTRLRLLDVVAGVTNTLSGLYAWGRSYVTFTNGKTPTVTGTVGDVSVDNTTQKSTWAAIAGGTPVTDTAEMVVVKKV